MPSDERKAVRRIMVMFHRAHLCETVILLLSRCSSFTNSSNRVSARCRLSLSSLSIMTSERLVPFGSNPMLARIVAPVAPDRSSTGHASDKRLEPCSRHAEAAEDRYRCRSGVQVAFGECRANVLLTLLRPKQGQKSGDILDPASNRPTERDSTRHGKTR